MKYTYSEGKYVILPCENVTQIVNEGKTLSHCVASNYSVAYAQQRTNIFFVRSITDIEKPLATLERISTEVVQCRASHNTRPSSDIVSFVKNGVMNLDLGVALTMTKCEQLRVALFNWGR